jgi:hypothetical protein
MHSALVFNFDTAGILKNRNVMKILQARSQTLTDLFLVLSFIVFSANVSLETKNSHDDECHDENDG